MGFSSAEIERRRALAPRPEFPPELPICTKREEIAKAISSNQVVIVCGETGSGKTTQLPKICLDIGRGTFCHRQHVWHDQATLADWQRVHVPLRHVTEKQGALGVW